MIIMYINKKTISGFSLLEIIIAMLILSIATAGTYGLFVTSYKFITEAKQRLQAVNQAAKVLERLRMYVRADDLGNALNPGTYLPSSPSPWPTELSSSPTFDSGITGNWNYSVSNVDATATPLTCKRVSVQIIWGE